jgi:hypothetical protein
MPLTVELSTVPENDEAEIGEVSKLMRQSDQRE